MNKVENDFNRRDFLKSGSLAALMALMDGVELRAQGSPPAPAGGAATTLTKIPVGPPVKYGVIGLGEQGREIVRSLVLMPNAPVTSLCDVYPASLRRAGHEAPTAAQFEDYHQLLASKDVEAVVVATPTHLHKEIVIDALAAGKHVYCEAPLAATIDDAKAIAKAARDSAKVLFQPGLQERAHPQRAFLVPFIREGALGQNVMARSQWHTKQSWRRSSPNPDHEKALNWRLDKSISPGLIGEAGIHQIDLASWFFKARPTAVTGFSSLILWNDGRDVPDTAQAVFEFPGGARLVYDATLCTSFDGAYELYYGSDATVMVRDEKAWLFKEVDAPLLGWEVYARKDTFYTETGIVLAANATKQSAIGTSATAAAFTNTPLYIALQAFTTNAGIVGREAASFIDSYGDSDMQALADDLAKLKLNPAPTWREGLDATILALKANEAANAGQKIPIDASLFDL